MANDSRYSPLRYRFAAFEFREQTGELWRQGQHLRLPEQAAKILLALLRASGEVVAREELRQALWPGKVFGDFDGGLNAAVRKLRRALEDDGTEPHLIGTLPKRGYRLLVPVETGEDAGPSDARPAGPSSLGGESRPVALAPLPRRQWLDRLVSVAARLRHRWGGQPRIARIRSLALLPLTNGDEDPAEDYLAASLTEQVIQELALRGDLQVAPLAAVRCLVRERLLPLELCRSLGVEALVEGSVRRQGEHLLIHLRLVLARSGLSSWAQSVKMPWTELSEVPAFLASRLATALMLPAGPGRRPAAHQDAGTLALYLKARHELSSLTPAGIERAIQLYERAIQKDPRFACAYAGLTTAELWQGILGKSGVSASLTTSYRHAIRALELDPACGDAHLALAFIHWLHDWDFAAAEESFRKVLELSPESFQAHAAFASYLFARGRDAEADPHLAQAAPYAQGDPMVAMDVLRCYTFARRHAEAIAFGRSILASRPQWTWAHGHIFEACLALGRNEEAVAANLIAVADRPLLERVLKGARWSGDLPSLLRQEAEWNETRHALGESAEGCGVVAYLWAAVGERGKALHWLETAIDAKDYDALFVLRYSYWDAFQGDPRFETALERMGLQGDPRAPALLKARSLA